MNTHLPTSSHLAPPYNILSINTRDETFNNIMTIQLGTSPLHFCCCAAPCHSYDHDMHFPWPYAHATPPPLPTTQPQPTWPLPQPSTAPTFPSPQPSAYPHPHPQPFQPPPFLSNPTATALTYGTPSTWTFVQRFTTSPASTPTTDAIRSNTTNPTHPHNRRGPFIAGPKHDPSSYCIPTFRTTIPCISHTSSWTLTTRNGQA